MDNRTLLQSVIENLTHLTLTTFLRTACSNFRPSSQDYGHYLKPDLPIQDLREIGRIQFPDERRLLVVVRQTHPSQL